MKLNAQAKSRNPNKTKTRVNPASSPVCFAEAPELQEAYKEMPIPSYATVSSKKPFVAKKPH